MGGLRFKWPKVHIGQILGYILENNISVQQTNIGKYKVRKASFYKGGFVHKVYVKTINVEGVHLKAAATTSQRIRDESHKVWVLIKLSRGILWWVILYLYSWLQQVLQSCH